VQSLLAGESAIRPFGGLRQAKQSSASTAQPRRCGANALANSADISRKSRIRGVDPFGSFRRSGDLEAWGFVTPIDRISTVALPLSMVRHGLKDGIDLSRGIPQASRVAAAGELQRDRRP